MQLMQRNPVDEFLHDVVHLVVSLTNPESVQANRGHRVGPQRITKPNQLTFRQGLQSPKRWKQDHSPSRTEFFNVAPSNQSYTSTSGLDTLRQT